MLRRNYVNVSEVDGADEATVALAEKLIDDYVGYQDKWLKGEPTGKISGAIGSRLYDENSNTPLAVTDNTYARCVIEIVDGAGAGQKRVLTASSESERSVTFEGATFDPALDSTSIYKIYQLAKFPRKKDASTYDQAWYKTIPEAVHDAVIAQTEFIIFKGIDYFAGDGMDMDSERIGNYSYQRASGGNGGQSSLVKMVAPQARASLRGITNRTGRLQAENPTCL